MCELSFSLVIFSPLHQMGVGWGLCICVRVYLCMGWRGVDEVKVCVIDKLCQIISESFYTIITMYIVYTAFKVYECVSTWTCM